MIVILTPSSGLATDSSQALQDFLGLLRLRMPDFLAAFLKGCDTSFAVVFSGFFCYEIAKNN